MENKQLAQLHKTNLPLALKEAINEVLNEDEAYVADELVELSEAILLQLAALGIAAYLSQSMQKEVFNDFIIQLFTSRAHAYNAGPLYRWAANMILELDDPLCRKLQPLFWEDDNGKQVLNKSIHQLALLRNEVMHGFFLLPPERNQKEATHLAAVLDTILKTDVFSLFSEDVFHFLLAEEKVVGFSSSWSIAEDQWEALEKAHDFGSLSSAIRYQYSTKFIKDQQELIEKQSKESHSLKEVSDFIEQSSKGAMAVWHRPNLDLIGNYASLSKQLSSDDGYLCVYQTLTSEGIGFTSNFILSRLARAMAEASGTDKYDADPRKSIKQLRKKCSAQPVLVIKDIHTCLFHPDHLLHLADLLYENGIMLIAFGVHHPWMDQFFNRSHTFSSGSYLPASSEWQPLFDNYLRYKGPNKEMPDQKKQYDQLLNITNQLIDTIKKENTVIARRFADQHEHPMEYVHEVFSILHPFLTASTESFEMDEMDELYNFPKQITEASRVYFSLGRRDAKLEYQHKKLTL